MKLRKLHIDNYKMFNNFDINFMDKNGNPLPIIVIAGINGSGKTTLLEYIFRDNFLNIGPFYVENSNCIELIDNNEIKTLNNEARKKKKEIDNYLKEMSKKNGMAGISYDDNGLFLYDLDKYITYIKAMENDIKDIKKNILEYYRKKSRELDSHSKALREIQSFVQNVFDGLGLNFNIDDINDVIQNEEKVVFKNQMGEVFQIESLSTGEKTLLSKVLNLYFKDVKNQIILIDEPELSLHPAWQNRVLKLYENFAKANNCQIIIATHSPHIIGSAKSEWIRLLTEDGVIDNFSNTYGAKFSQILTDIMGVKNLRTPEVNEKFVAIENMIINNEFDTQEFKIKWQELEDMLGKSYFDLKLLKLEIASRRKDVQNNKK
ncbi:MAG: Unknown protein [uncultured Sulfurovum sp.]|uniref:AAA+ ATPase domain-containing protein n=1 Tax=uncultured Sulfurovum sp. TaxID=269237 RepID=A0A6S6TQN1_9BACT|nr:MAG: Unknown protein [uncultured Sulfurovum sp.]